MNLVPAEPSGARRLAILATGLALLLRTGVALLLRERLFWPDESMYLAYAQRVAHNQWLGPRAFTFVPPGQYYTLGVLFHLFPASALAARLVLAVASTASVWLLYRMVRRVSPWGGAVAAAALAVYPLTAYTAATLYPQTLAQCYLLCVLNLLCDQLERPSWGRMVGAGILLGLTALTVPTILTICPLVGIWLWASRGSSWRGAGEVAVLAVVAAAAISPWIYRNYRVEHRFIPIATVGSQIFFFANNPKADPDSKNLALVDSVYTPEIKAEIERTRNPDQVYAAHASEFIRREPGRFLLYYSKRLRHFFDWTPHTFSSNAHTGKTADWIVGLSSGPALLLGLLGAIFLCLRGGASTLLVLVPLAWAMASAVFGVTIRYRVPIEPLILGLAGAAVVRLATGRVDAVSWRRSRA